MWPHRVPIGVTVPTPTSMRRYAFRLANSRRRAERAGLRDTDTEMMGGADDDGASGRRADDDIIE